MQCWSICLTRSFIEPHGCVSSSCSSSQPPTKHPSPSPHSDSPPPSDSEPHPFSLSPSDPDSSLLLLGLFSDDQIIDKDCDDSDDHHHHDHISSLN